MLKLFAFLFHTFPLILAYLYLLVAVLAIALHIKNVKRQAHISLVQWIFMLGNLAYVLMFIVTAMCFPNVWKTLFACLGTSAVVVSFVRSRYDEKRNGQRWWTW